MSGMIVAGEIHEGEESRSALMEAFNIRNTLGLATLDKDSEAELWIEYNTIMNALPATQAYLSRSVDLMSIGMGKRVLDNGARNSPDMAKMLYYCPDEIYINERNNKLLYSACLGGAAVFNGTKVQASSDSPDNLVSISDHFFNSARAMKLLQQHTPENGQRIVNEMTRVTRPDGALVFCDLDWCNITTSNEEINKDLSDVLFYGGNPVSNPFAAQDTADWLSKAGKERVKRETVTIVSSYYERFQLTTGWDRNLDRMQENGMPSEEVSAKKDLARKAFADHDTEIHIPVIYTIGTAPS